MCVCVCVHLLVCLLVWKSVLFAFSLLSIRHSSKINPLNDFAPGTSRVQMGGECVGVSFRIAIKKPLCIDDDATDTYC